MATSREYAYFIKGNKLAIVEKDWKFEEGLYAERNLSINDTGYVGELLWKSPIESITDGLEIEYVYSPEYYINDLSSPVISASYTTTSGYLTIVKTGNWAMTADEPIVIKDSERWNGLHYVKTDNENSSTNLVLKTKYNGGSVNEVFNIYGNEGTNVVALQDEDFELDVTRYQANAIVYYVKAKMAEDAGRLDLREYFMKEFRRSIEKHESNKKIGPYRTQGYTLFNK